MSQVFVEGDLEFRVPKDLPAQKLDEKGVNFPGADCLIDLSDFYLILEVKDYDGPRKTGSPNDPSPNIENFQLAWQNLLPTLYRSYIRIFDRDRLPEKRVVYVCLIGYENLDNPLRAKLTNDLRDVVERIGPNFGEQKLPPSIQVLTLAQWNSQYPNLPASRLSQNSPLQ